VQLTVSYKFNFNRQRRICDLQRAFCGLTGQFEKSGNLHQNYLEHEKWVQKLLNDATDAKMFFYKSSKHVFKCILCILCFQCRVFVMAKT